jgi:hypothetical protein
LCFVTWLLASAAAAGEEKAAGARELAALAPADTILYLEIDRPGRHLGRILDAAGLLGQKGTAGQTPKDSRPRFAVSPRLVEALQSIEAAALALTDVEPRRGTPSGLLVVDPGSSDLVYGLIETALSAAAAAGELRLAEPMDGGIAVYEGPMASIAITGTLAFAASSRDLLAGALARLRGGGDSSLAASAAFQEARARGGERLAFAFADARAVLERVKAEAFRGGEPPSEYRMLQALADVESVRWASLEIGSSEAGITARARLRLDDANQSLAFHLFRTPPVGRGALRAAPAGAAVVLALALGDPGTAAALLRAEGAAPAAPITGLDLARELFANVKDAVGFVLPWSEAPSSRGAPPIPDAGLVFTARDVAKSEALWRQLLGVAAILARGDVEPVRVESIDGHESRVFSFPERVRVHLVGLPDRVVVATSARAAARAMAAAGGKEHALDDPAFAAAWGKTPEAASKVLLVHAGRAFDLIAPFAELRGPEADAARESLAGSAAALTTFEDRTGGSIQLVLPVPRLDGVLERLFSAHESARARRGGPERAAARASARSSADDTAPATAAPRDAPAPAERRRPPR